LLRQLIRYTKSVNSKVEEMLVLRLLSTAKIYIRRQFVSRQTLSIWQERQLAVFKQSSLFVNIDSKKRKQQDEESNSIVRV
jgi:hypothetical protein